MGSFRKSFQTETKSTCKFKKKPCYHEGTEEYFDAAAYEDEYSGNMIEEYQVIFKQKISEYLHNTYPGKFVVTGGPCVFVLTKEEAMKRDIFNWERKVIA